MSNSIASFVPDAIAQGSCSASDSNPSSRENPDMLQFAALLAQVKHENMPSLALSIRRGNEDLHNKGTSPPTSPLVTGCKVLPKPLYGSYHLAYRVLFDDGVQWILKIPVHGHPACFDRLASEALTSEALTMKMIRQTTTIPIPTVHHFDASCDNKIGCPYILMDFLKGRPLWQGWFDETASHTALEQFRARSLQTIAAAMVQLSQFTTKTCGSLRFDSSGQPRDVAGAKVPDWLAEQDIILGLKTEHNESLYCEKGPITEPGSSFLFMLNRRGVRETDGPCERGVHEIMRLFTDWLLEKAGSTHEKGQRFVLAHPDFAMQNFLVEDDGTLCGVIDWDGVAAVPVPVGCLRYPDWLMSDWHPWYKRRPGFLESEVNSPEELATYRNMYAQFVEAYSSFETGCSKAGKATADITRMSLVASSLDVGANDLKLTGGTVRIIFEKLADLMAISDDSDVSEADSESSVGNISDDSRDRSGGEISTGDDSSNYTTPTEAEEMVPNDAKKNSGASIGLEVIIKSPPDQALAKDVSEITDQTSLPTVHATGLGQSALEQVPDSTAFPNSIHAQEIASNYEVPVSQKRRFCTWPIGSGGKRFTAMITTPHERENTKSKPSRMARMAKWALDLGKKGCRGAAKIIYKTLEDLNLQQNHRSEALSKYTGSQFISRPRKFIACLRERTGIFVRTLITHMHEPRPAETSLSNRNLTKTSGSQPPCAWPIFVPEKLIQKIVQGGLYASRMFEAIGIPWSAGRVLLEAKKHGQGCQLVIVNHSQKYTNDGASPLHKCSADVWGGIAADIDKCGIPLDLVKKHRDLIVQCITSRLTQEAQREEKEDQLKSHETTGKEREDQNEANKTSLNKTSDSKTILRPVLRASMVAQSDIAGSVAKTDDGETPFGDKSPEIFPAEAESDLKGITDKPGPLKLLVQKTAAPESLAITSEQPSPHGIDTQCMRPQLYTCESSPPESLIVRLKAAKQSSDLKKASKGQDDKPASQRDANTCATITQSEDTKLKKSTRAFLTPQSTKDEADLKLRTIMLSLQKPNTHSVHYDSNASQSAEDPEPAEKVSRQREADAAKRTNLSKIKSINEKLRTILSNVKGPKNTDARSRRINAAKDEDDETKCEHNPENLPLKLDSDAHSQDSNTTFMGGRWFESPTGDLKRIEEEESLNLGSHGQRSTLRSEDGFPREDQSSSKASVSESAYEDPIKALPLKPKASNRQVSHSVNVFKVPDIDEKEDGAVVQGLTEDNTSKQLHGFEIVGIGEEAAASASNQFQESGYLSGRELSEAGTRKKPRANEVVDSGHFTATEVCIALGNSSLDDQRMARLKEGFIALLDDMVGRRR